MARIKKVRRTKKQEPIDYLFVMALSIVACLFVLPLEYKIILVLLLFAGAGLYVAFVLHLQYKQLLRITRSGIKEIDQMEGVEFEKRLVTLFQSKGYQVEQTPGSYDYGADLVLKKDGIITVVQAKHSKLAGKKIDQDAVRQVVASCPRYHATEMMVVTNRKYTAAAENNARLNFVVLWDREKLIEEIISMQELHGIREL